MIVKAAGLGSARNGLVTLRPYVYNGTGADILEPDPRLAPVPRRERQPRVTGRILEALRSLGGEAFTSEIRTALDFDGGPAFEPGYLGTALGRLARRGEVTLTGRDGSKGRPARWRLGPGAGGGG